MLYVCLASLQLPNQLTCFHGSWYEIYTVGGN